MIDENVEVEEVTEIDVETSLEETEETQWSKAGNVYSPSMPTVKKLPAGYYKYFNVWGQIRFARVPISLKGILKLNSRNVKDIVQDIESFWDREELFKQYKVPYKRGILLSGPPGTGKTCLIKMLIADLIKRDGVCLEFNYNLEDLTTSLEYLESIQPETPVIVIIEDIDRMRVSSVLLNILDGVISLHNVVFVATTNHPEDLDEALVNRPGRIDAHFKIDPPSASVRRQFIKSILSRGDASTLPIDQWVKDTEDLPLGHIKELIISTVVLGKDYQKALEMVKSMRDGQEDSDEIEDCVEPDCGIALEKEMYSLKKALTKGR